MNRQSTVRVVIHGTELTFKTDDPDYIHALAGFVNEQVDKIGSSGKVAGASKLLALAAFNIAYELFRLRTEKDEMAKTLSERLDTLLDEADGAYRSIRLPVNRE